MSLSSSSSSTAIGSSDGHPSDSSSVTYTPDAKPSQISYTTKSTNAYPLASKPNGHNITASFGVNNSVPCVSTGTTTGSYRPSSGRSSNLSVRPSSADSFASCNSNTTTFSIIKVLDLMRSPYKVFQLNVLRQTRVCQYPMMILKLILNSKKVLDLPDMLKLPQNVLMTSIRLKQIRLKII